MGQPVASLEIQLVSDIARLQRDMKDAQRAIDGMSNAGTTSAGRLGGAFRAANDNIAGVSRGAAIAQSALSALSQVVATIGLGAIAGQIVQTNAEFQSLTASLKIATGSMEGAGKAMEMLKTFAAETPYGLQQSVEAFIKLKNLGLTPSIEAMRAYGNTASSMGKDLMQMVEAVADATTGEFERLKEFGIKASAEGDKVKFTFAGVSTTVANTSAEIEKYLQNLGNTKFAGAMAEQMKTLNGQWAGLMDNLDALYVAIGQLGANNALTGMMAGAADAIKFVGDNLDTIVTLLGTAAVAYGTYTAAVVIGTAATAAMSGVTGIWIGTIATAYTQLGLLAAAEVAVVSTTAGLSAAFGTLTTIMLANPAVWLAGAVTALALTFKMMSDAGAAAEERLRANAAAAKELGITLTSAGEAALRASGETASVGSSAASSTPQIWSFKNASDNLTESLWAQAKAARAARVEMLQQTIAKAKARADEAKDLTAGGPQATFTQGNQALLQGDLLKSGPLLWKGLADRWKQVLSNGRVTREAARDYADSTKVLAAAERQLKEAMSTPLGKSDIPAAMARVTTAREGAARAAQKLGGVERGHQKDLANTAEQLVKLRLQIMATSQAMETSLGKSLLPDLIAEDQRQWDDFNRRVRGGVEDAGVATADWNAELRDTVRLLDSIGKGGQALGDIAAAIVGLTSGDFSGSRGPLSGLLQTIGDISWRESSDDGRGQIRILREEIVGALDKVFGGNGSFAQTMTGVLQGAGTGAAVGGILGGGKTSQLGSQLGGAIGQAVGTKLLSSLGAAAGPVGAIGGAILGSIGGDLLKGILSPNRSASANITGANSVNVNGKDRAQYGAANDLAGSVTSGLKQIADAFGAQLGAFQVAIGTRGDEIRVNTGGTSLKTGAGAKGFGEDAEAAARYAILDAINDGALKGMREGSLNLLKAGDDLDAALQKATSFENVFAELRNASDPTGAALEQLDKQFAQLRTIFEEAGASAAEYADLERLLSIRREEVLSKERDALDDVRSRIAEALGDDETVRAIERQRELKDAMSDTVRVELERLYAIENMTRGQEESAAAAQAAADAQQELADAQKAAAEAAQAEADRLANSLGDLQIRLARAQGNDALAEQLEQARELSAARTQEEKDYLNLIYAVDRAMAAQQAAADAQSKIVDAQSQANDGFVAMAGFIADMTNQMRQASAGLREFANELFGKNTVGDTDAMRRQVLSTMEMAGMGDQAAIAKLPDLINSYLPNAMKAAGSMNDYLREVALFAQGSRDVADVNDARADYSATVLSSWARDGSGLDMRTPAVAGAMAEQLAAIKDAVADLKDTIKAADENNVQGHQRVIANTGKAADTLDQVSNGGFAVMMEPVT
jgi:hypothetical protein